MAKKSPELNFSFNVSEPFIKECADFLNLPNDDALARTASQLFASNFSLSNDLNSAIDRLSASVNNFNAQVNEQWTTLQTTTLQTLNTTVLTVGQVSTHHENISQSLTELTDLYKESGSSNLEFQKRLKSLGDLFQTLKQQTLLLENGLSTLMSGSDMNVKTRESPSSEFMHSMEELSNLFQQAMEQMLHLQKSTDTLKQLQNQKMKEEIIMQLKNHMNIVREETRDFLRNFQSIIIIFFLATLMLFGMTAWMLSYRSAWVSANTTNINSFGGETYHRVALRIMDSEYRDENLKRLENCREKNKKIQSPVMECYLKVERS